MRRFLLISTSIGIASLVVVVGAVQLDVAERLSFELVEPDWNWLRKAKNVDGTHITRSQLNWMAADIVTYFKACDAAEWHAICELSSPEKVWAILEKKIEITAEKENGFVDVWGDRYLFDVRRSDEAVLIRMSSKGNGAPLNGTPMFIELEFEGTQRVIRQRASWNSAVFEAEVPEKVDGWILKHIP